MANSIDGRVVDAISGRPGAGLSVEAIGRSQGERIGAATTDREGTFSIPLDERRFKLLVTTREDVGFRVSARDGSPLDVTGSPLWNARRQDEPLTISVSAPEPTPDQPEQPELPLTVRGVVTDTAGVAGAGLRIEAWDHQIADQSVVASTVTGGDGRYLLVYDRAALGGKDSPDLEVRVLGRDGVLLVSSGIRFDAAADLTVDLVVERTDVPTPAEYDRLIATTGSLRGGRALGDLDADGISYLAGRTGWDARTIAMAAQAEKLSAQSQIPSGHYYALMRAGLPGDPDQIHRLADGPLADALARSAADGVIADDGTIEATVRLHREAATTALRTLRPSGTVSSLGEMMAVRLDDGQQATMIDVLRSSGDDPVRLWTALGERGFDERTVTALQTDAELGHLTRQNAPLIARLTGQFQVGSASELADKGFHRPEAWLSVIENDLPEGITADAYAAGLALQVEQRFPARVTANLVRTQALDLGAAGGEVADFFAAPAQDAAIGIAPVRGWPGFAELSPPAREGALKVERLYQITPSNEAMVALSSLGLDSALQVAKYSPNQFLATFGDKFPSITQARLVHQKAQEVYTTALMVATTYLSYRGAPNVYAISGSLARTAPAPAPESASATLEDLFGSLDYCSCDSCRSVLSPAAYFVELLEFLDRSDVPHVLDNPLDALLARRPDLQHLALSCENTNVALPYVDIVLEILEHWVVAENLSAFTGHDIGPDTKTADLLADPEFVVDSAYDMTKAAVFPSGLPFDAPLEHLRQLFEVWDTSLPVALDLLGPPAAARREWLRLNAEERSILTDVTFRELPEYFGEPAGTTIEQLNAVIANAKTFCRRTGVSYAELAQILTSPFVNPGAGGDAIVLTDLTLPGEPGRACDFGRFELRFARPDLATNQLTELEFHRLHRFVRLWRKLGWSLEQTDVAVTAFLGSDPATLTTATLDVAVADLLDRLAGFVRLTTRRGLKPKQVTAWLALFDPAGDVSTRTDRLAGLLRIGTTDLATLIELTGIDPFADDLGSDTPSLDAIADAVTALKASPLKATDVDYLLRHADEAHRLAPSEAELQRDLLTLRAALAAVDADLAVPVAAADLGAAAAKMALVYDRLVVDQFLTLVAGTTTYTAPLTLREEVLPAAVAAVAPAVRIDPFHATLASTGPLNPAPLAAAVTAVGALALADLQNIDTAAELATFKTELTTALQALHDASVADLDRLGTEHPELRALYDSLAAITDPPARAAAIVTGILTGLRATLRAAALRTTLANLTKSTVELVDALTLDPAVLHAEGNPAAGVLTDVTGLEAGPDLGADGTTDLLLEPPTSTEYLFYVAAPPGTQITLVVDGAVVIAATTVGPGGEARGSAAVTLTAGRPAPATLTLTGLPAGGRAEVRWRTAALAKSAVPAARMYLVGAFTRARASILRIHKAVLLAGSLGLTPAEVADLGTRPGPAGIWSALDVGGTATAAEVHDQWDRLSWLLWFRALKDGHEQEENTLLGLLRAPTAVDARGRLVLAGVMEWAEGDLSAILGAFGLTVGDLGQVPELRRVLAAMDLVTASQQPAADLVAWTVPAPDASLVRGLRATLRARMSDASWHESMQSVSDQVRNARRDALVAYILQHAVPAPGIETADELYEYFLVDVQMDACMQTSRMRLALSTVQLFVNRCLLNLELRVSPDSINAEHWTWMRRYRVWEANRKVFLYPENWLEPELRDGKSPFFRDLESELLKADITQDLAETAYLHYLQKLDDVARLEIAGAYLEPRDPGTADDDVLHVIGRTLGATREHWYRRYEYGYWTPWEKIPLNIEGDVVVPVIWKKRLFVFWTTAVVQAQGDPAKSPTDLADLPWGGAARVDATVTVHRGEYFNGRWTSPKTTETTTALTFASLPSFDPTRLRVHTRTYTPAAAPGRPPLSERLELWLGYRQDSTVGTYYLTFTSTNSAPYVSDDDPFWVYLGREAQLLELSRVPLPRVDANSWVYLDKEFTVRVEQPSDPKTPVPMKVLTKTGDLLDGFRVRPVLHYGANPWELPLFYTDERSVFFVAGDERQYTEHTHYFVEQAVLDASALQLSKLVEKPVRTAIPTPVDPVIDPPYELRLPRDFTFTFAGTSFDAGGAVQARRLDPRIDERPNG